MKCHKYNIEEFVTISNPLHNNIENLKNRVGIIHSFVYGDLFDYEIYLYNEIIKVKESEISPLKEMKIALMSKMRAGKDTLAQYAIEKYGFKRFAFGDGIRESCWMLFPNQMEGGKNRHLLQRYGQMMRYEFDENVWVNYCFKSISDNIRPVISDLRQPNEFLRCKQEGYKIIKIHTDNEIRLQRMNEKGDKFSLADLEHETEQYIDNFEYDYIIYNNGNIDDAYRQFDEIMEDMLNERRTE